MGSGIQAADTYKLQNESTIYGILVSCVVLMEAIFPCFNLKPDDRKPA